MKESRTLRKTVEILLVEDSPADVRLLVESLKDARSDHHLNVAWDGEEALAYLRHEGHFEHSPRPDLVIMDLNLPRKDGREVLREMKNDPLLRLIPVVILTTSDAESDILYAYEMHASSYIVKPVRLDKYTEIVKAIEKFWLIIATLPPHRD
jgi:two-component system, chemotaxis family, response regulator Rcp1